MRTKPRAHTACAHSRVILVIDTSTANMDDETMGLGCTPQHANVTFDSSLQQATMVTPGTPHEYKEDYDELDPANKMEQIDSTRITNRTGTNDDYKKEDVIKDSNEVFENWQRHRWPSSHGNKPYVVCWRNHPKLCPGSKATV